MATSFRAGSQFHELGHRLSRYAASPVPQLSVDARCAIALLAVLEDHTDLINQRIPPARSRRPVRGCAAPSVKPAPAHARHPAHQTYGVIGEVGSPSRDIASQCTVGQRMNARLVFMSSPPTERKKPMLCASPHSLPSAVCCLGAVAPAQPPRLWSERSPSPNPPPAARGASLQLTGRDPQLRRKARVGHARLGKACHRLLLVFRRKPPPRLLGHLLLPVQRLL